MMYGIKSVNDVAMTLAKALYLKMGTKLVGNAETL
jgi:hypothetical protein